MPNIKSAKKRVKVNSVKALNNQMAKSELKTTLKKFDAAIAGGDKAEATAAYTTAVILSTVCCRNSCTRRTMRPTRRAR